MDHGGTVLAAAVFALAFILPGWVFGTLIYAGDARNPTMGEPIDKPALRTGTWTPGSLVLNGSTRTYYLYIPDVYKDAWPLPLVIALHGAHEKTGVKMARVTGLNALADRHRFAVVYPKAAGNRRLWNDGHSATASGPDDLSFIAALITHLTTTRDIDPIRVYAMGASNGGMMTLRLACELSDRIAAFVSVIANFPSEYAPRCAPKRPVPIMMINSTGDLIIPWAGGRIVGTSGRIFPSTVLSTMDSIRFWVRHNGCAGKSELTRLPDADPNDGTRVDRYRYAPCRQGVEVVLLAVVGGGHQWPGTKEKSLLPRTGRTSRDINAGEEAWRFLQAQTLPRQTPSPSAP